VLGELEDSIQGPFVLGEQISLADLLIFPWLKRWVGVKALFDFPIPAKYAKIHKLIELLEQRPSAVEIRKESPDDFLIERFRAFFKP
jgi:glutathione S-transferase